MGSNIIESRRKLFVSPFDFIDGTVYHISAESNANDITSTPKLSNSYGTALGSTKYSGKIIVTQSKWPNSNDFTNYQNGYFVFVVDLENGVQYRFTANAKITANPLSSNLLRIRINNVSSKQFTTSITDGKLNFTFTPQSNGGRKGLYIYNGGKSLVLNNIHIVKT